MKNVANLDDEKWMKEIWDWADKSYIDEDIIPRQSKELIELKNLELERNKNITRIPKSIGNLKYLEKFSLVGTNVKKIPSSIGKLLSLKSLDIYQNTKIIE